MGVAVGVGLGGEAHADEVASPPRNFQTGASVHTGDAALLGTVRINPRVVSGRFDNPHHPLLARRQFARRLGENLSSLLGVRRCKGDADSGA